VEILIEWIPRFFFMGECRCEDIYILFWKYVVFFCFSISNSVYSERGKIKRGKLSVSRDMSQADTVLRFCVRLDVTLTLMISIIRQFLVH
jgi:hypothetical protein